MNDVLSQAEIDKLLKEITMGEEEGIEAEERSSNSYGRYDFKTANRFTKEQIRTINMIHKNFCYLLSNMMIGTLRTDCEAEILSIEEMPFNEFNNSVPSPVIIAIINTVPFASSIIMQISKEISYSIINRVLGGTKEVSSDGRQFTEIELAIIERVLWQILKIQDEAWSKILEVSSSLEKIETSMQFAQIVDINEAVLTVTLNITIGEESGIIGYCLPHQALETFMKNIDAKLIYSGKSSSKVLPQTKDIVNTIKNTDILVSCVFNTTKAPISDIMNLHEGDVIQLQHPIDEPLIVKFQDVPKYQARIGKLKNNLAIKIVDTFAGEKEIE